MAGRIFSFFVGTGVGVVAYGSLRDSLFAQQRAIHTRLAEASGVGHGGAAAAGLDGEASPSRVKILAELEIERKSLFKQMGDRWNGTVMGVYSLLTGRLPR